MDKAVKQRAAISPAVFFSLLRQALKKLVHNDPLRMAGATAFFTSFALPFLLIIISQLLGLFIDKATARRDLYQTLGEMLGYATINQVVEILRAFRSLARNPLVAAVGFLFLLMVSTTLLMVVKGSMNQLLRIKLLPGRTFFQKLGTRLRSLLVIISTSILFFLSVLAEGLKAHLDKTIISVAPAFATYFVSFGNYIFSVVFVTFWFAIIFRVLPDAKVPWKVALVGAFVTSLLFNIGKYFLRVLLVNSDLDTMYGASASIVLLLLFVFYSSLIMYYGVAFTRVWAEHWHQAIRPMRHATHYKLEDVDENF